jgi:N-acyl-D-amino-acid deacylase
MNYDCLIKNGTVVDGTGEKAFRGALALKDGRIGAIIEKENDIAATEKGCSEVIDAAGLIVCPGFIDMHSHADWVLPLPDHPKILSPLLEQGITTVVAGNCGYSPAPLKANSLHLDLVAAESEFLADRPFVFEWDSMDSFLSKLASDGVALNLAMLVGHGNLRLSMFGSDFSYPGDEAINSMKDIATSALEEGAFGISLGLGYAPGLFSEMRELENFAHLAREHNRLLTVHLKAYTKLSGAYPLKIFGNQPHNLTALQEMITLAEQTGVKMQISHLLFVGSKTWPLAEQCLALIEKAVDGGADIAFDSFPYTCGNTTIYIAYPTWFRNNIEANFRSKAARLRVKFEVALISSQLGFGLEDFQVIWGGHPEVEPYEGLFFGQIAKKMGCSIAEAFLRVSELSKGKTLCLMQKYNGDDSDQSVLDQVICHPLNLIETDTILTTRGIQNPSSFGTFPRVIQRYHKELAKLSLEETVAKMTGRSAERFGLKDRGTIKPGHWADLTIFDYDQIADNTTSEELEIGPSGIHTVLVNGKVVVDNGAADTSLRAGKVLRSS